MAIRLAGAILLRRKLDFGQEARLWAQQLNPPLQILGIENIPGTRPCVITVNHLARPGFRAWWFVLAISAVVKNPIHWVMASAWTTPNPWLAPWWTPITHWIFQRIAWVYGFTSMPPMPPDPQQVEWRANSVRAVLHFARDQLQNNTPPPIVGLAPEGGDMPGGVLAMPPSGVGRFILQLVKSGLEVTPVGVYLDRDGLCLNFGPAYRPVIDSVASRDELDWSVRLQVMQKIAVLLPFELRGEFVDRLDPAGIKN